MGSVENFVENTKVVKINKVAWIKGTAKANTLNLSSLDLEYGWSMPNPDFVADDQHFRPMWFETPCHEIKFGIKPINPSSMIQSGFITIDTPCVMTMWACWNWLWLKNQRKMKHAEAICENRKLMNIDEGQLGELYWDIENTQRAIALQISGSDRTRWIENVRTLIYKWA